MMFFSGTLIKLFVWCAVIAIFIGVYVVGYLYIGKLKSKNTALQVDVHTEQANKKRLEDQIDKNNTVLAQLLARQKVEQDNIATLGEEKATVEKESAAMQSTIEEMPLDTMANADPERVEKKINQEMQQIFHKLFDLTSQTTPIH